jgi:hypothetical protein
MAKVPSADDKRKDKDGNDIDKVLSIPDWNKVLALPLVSLVFSCMALDRL